MIRRFSSNDWIAIAKRVNSPRVRLLCFPHGGGSANTFYAWPRNLPEDVEVCALELPGRGRRLFEAPVTSIDEIIEPLWEAFQPFRGTPVAFFGHSLGASVAFEFARTLQSRKIPLMHLFVAGQSAPQLPDLEPPIRNLPDREFISEVCQRYGGLPEEILRNEEIMALILPTLRADLTMKERYRYVDGPLLVCPISSFGGHQDSTVPFDELCAWRDQTCRGFGIRMFPGGHFFVDSARESLLKFVAADLEHSLRGSFSESNVRVGTLVSSESAG
ncbi:MAG: thioesterase II family protein [Vicinamibacteria bacterium]